MPSVPPEGAGLTGGLVTGTRRSVPVGAGAGERSTGGDDIVGSAGSTGTWLRVADGDETGADSARVDGVGFTPSTVFTCGRGRLDRLKYPKRNAAEPRLPITNTTVAAVRMPAADRRAAGGATGAVGWMPR